jgi:hypothetical protein
MVITSCLAWFRALMREMKSGSSGVLHSIHRNQRIAMLSNVGNSPPLWPNPPFHEFPKHFNHSSWFQISSSGNSRKGRFVSKAGVSGGELPTSGQQLAPFLERISYGLGQRYHYFDEISRGLGNIIIILMQPGYCSEKLDNHWTT